MTDAAAVAASRGRRSRRTRSSTARSSTTSTALRRRGAGRRGTRTSAHPHVVDAANAAGAQVVLVSTDWVFDGTQSGADEDDAAEPGQRLRVPEGRLRAGRGRARRAGAVARVGRQRHAPGPAPTRRGARTPASATSWPRSSTRCGDGGASRSGRARRSTWSPPRCSRATPPSSSGIVERRLDRRLPLLRRRARSTARPRAADRRGVRPRPGAARLRSLRRPKRCRRGRFPYDTSLSGRATERALDVRLPDLETLLARLRAELEGSLV